MSEERLKEIKDSIDFQIKIGGMNILVSEEQKLYNEVIRLRQVIEKAIKYIENEDIDVCSIRNNDIQDTKQELLDILKGSDKSE